MKPKALEDHPNVGPTLRWVSEGTKAWVLIEVQNIHGVTHHRWILAECTCASGRHGRFKSEHHNYEKWHDVGDCFAYVPTLH